MKKVILLLLLIVPLAGFAQRKLAVDTITYERDTIIKYRITGEYTGHWFLVVDSLAGTLDSTIELVVADDVLNAHPTSTFPDDSVFVRYTENAIDTLTVNGEYSFFWDQPISYDYVGLKITKNNATKWHIYWKRILYNWR